MSSNPRTHSRASRRTARIWIVLMFFGFVAANAMLWYFTERPMNPWPMLKGHVVGSALGTTVLLIGILRRQFWARFVLIFFLWYLITVFSIVALIVSGDRENMEQMPVMALLVAIGIMIVSNILLIRSRSIQRLMQTLPR